MKKAKINIIIPMAGAGSRFQKDGYDLPKPFININGKMMIERVLKGLQCDNANYKLIIQKSFLNDYKKELNIISSTYKNIEFFTVEKLTQGASCTALSIHKEINNNDPVLICDCDNIIENDVFKKFVHFCATEESDGVLMTFESSDSRFSFAKLDKNNIVCKVKEKEAISNNAMSGFYFISKGVDFVNSAINTMIYGDRDKNEFYISTVYQDLINNGKKIKTYKTTKDAVKCVGTPDQLLLWFPIV